MLEKHKTVLSLYRGDKQPQPGERDEKGRLLYPYIPDNELRDAVNLAIYLKRPLLIKGEPGCGKTRLASAVAYELGLSWNSWNVKSTSQAKDGLYTYDTVGRLRDAQLAAVEGRRKGNNFDLSQYIHWGPLGEAFRQDQPMVVLIDEIDKADIDFPNDLLTELDDKRFSVDEMEGKIISVKEGNEPIIFITSNDEKDLPDAFLRRCLFHYIKFPDEERLTKIVKLHFREAPDSLVSKAVERFRKLRQRMEADKGETGKKVSTSELIDWFRVLACYPTDEAMAAVRGKLPASILLKSWDDHLHYMGLIDAEE